MATNATTLWTGSTKDAYLEIQEDEREVAVDRYDGRQEIENE